MRKILWIIYPVLFFYFLLVSPFSWVLSVSEFVASMSADASVLYLVKISAECEWWCLPVLKKIFFLLREMGLSNWDLRTEVLLDCLAVSKDVYFVGPTLRTRFTLRVMSLLLFLLSTDSSSLSASLMYFPSRYTCHRREFPLVSALLDIALPRMAAPCNSDFKIVIFFFFGRVEDQG